MSSSGCSNRRILTSWTTTAKVPRSFGPDLRSWCLRPIEAYSGRFEGTLVMLADEALQKRPHEPNSEKVPPTAEHQLLGKMAPPTRSGHDSAASSSATAGPSRIDEAHAMHVARHFADLHRRRRFTDLKVRSPHPVFRTCRRDGRQPSRRLFSTLMAAVLSRKCAVLRFVNQHRSTDIRRRCGAAARSSRCMRAW